MTNAAIRKINRRPQARLRHGRDLVPIGQRPRWANWVISAEYAVAEAGKRKIPVEEELLRYVAHGILHLLGYDDHRPADKKRMWSRQERELRRILKTRSDA